MVCLSPIRHWLCFAENCQWFFLFEIFYCISIIFIKLSISFTLIRVAGPMRRYIYSLYVCSALFTISNLIALFYIIFQCKPVSYAAPTQLVRLWLTLTGSHGTLPPKAALAILHTS
jgi:hypothetical protein